MRYLMGEGALSHLSRDGLTLIFSMRSGAGSLYMLVALREDSLAKVCVEPASSDFRACAELVSVSPPPGHANRGNKTKMCWGL